MVMFGKSAWATETYFAIYLNGGKVGYSVTRELDAGWSESETVFRSALMGQDLEMRIVSRTRTGSDGRPIEMRYSTESGGRTQVVLAKFSQTEIRATIDNGGVKSERTIPIPPGARVVDDATSNLVLSGAGAQKSFKVHVLDPTTVTLIENEVKVNGSAKVEVGGRIVDATLVTVTDPRAASKIYFSSKGDVIKIEAALGMVMLPVSKEVAISLDGPRTDLGESAAIKVNPPIDRSLDLLEARFEVTGADLSRCPSDSYQTVTRLGDRWMVTIHPVDRMAVKDRPISEANRYAKKWIVSSLHIPVGTSQFQNLTKQILGGERRVLKASEKISLWIERSMRPNAGIGVLRDATEVLASKEGVCRDYAILGATLMRNAGIPSRVASGLIYENGQMYYHAWNEVWSGDQWVLFDPTRASHPTNATRFKLAHGNVEEAFTFTVLQGSSFKTISTKYRS